MANYAAETPTELGLNPSMRTPANGDTVPGGCTLFVRNTNAAPLTLTITTPKTQRGDLAVADRVTSAIAATTGLAFIQIPNDENYVDPLTGLVTISNWSVTSGVTYAVLRGV